MSVGQTDFESILPWFEFPPSKIFNAVKSTTANFSDAVLFLPLFGNYRYEKGAGKKILSSYWLGAGFVLLFLAVFYGLYTTTAPTHHYAFAKTALYFPALKTVGRIDLIFIYLLTVILFYAHVLPIRFCVLCIEKTFLCSKQIFLSASVNALLFLFVFFFNKHQNAVFQTVTQTLWWIFPCFSILIPVLCALLPFLPKIKPPKANSKKSVGEKESYAR